MPPRGPVTVPKDPKVKRRRKPVAGTDRSDAAQRTGARTPKVKPNKLTAKPVSGTVKVKTGVVSDETNVAKTPKVGTAATRERAKLKLTPRQEREVHRRAQGNSARAKKFVKRIRKDILDAIDPKKVYTVGTGTGPPLLVANKHGSKFASAGPIAVRSEAFGRIGKNFIRDAIDLPANTVTSTYQVGKTAVKGHPAEAGKMLLEPVVETVKHPIKSFEEHPLNTYLIGKGAKGAVGRGAGGTMRSGALGKTAKRAASTERAPKVIPGAKRTVRRQYSKDIITKGGQVLHERHQAKVRAKRGKPTEQVASAKDIRRAVDEDVQAAKIVTEHNQSKAATAARDAVAPRKGRVRRGRRKPDAGMSLAAQGITDGTKADLARYLEEIRGQEPKLKGARLERNRATQREIEKALKNYDPAEVSRAVKAYQAHRAELDSKIVERGLVTASDAEATRLAAPAVRRLGISEEARKAAKADTKSVRKGAVKIKKQAGRDLAAAQRDLEKARSNARISVAQRKQSPALKEAIRNRDRAVRTLAQLERQGAAKSARNAAVRKHSNAKQIATAKVRRAEIAEQVRVARLAVREANARVDAERARIAGVAPKQADELRAAMYARDDARAARSRAVQDAEAARRVHVDTKNATYVNERGSVSLDDVRAAGGYIGEPAYVSHQPIRSRTPALSRDLARPAVRETRTGEAVRTGELDAHPAKLVEQSVDSQRTIDAADAHARFVDDYGLRDKDGELETFRNQKKAADTATSRNLQHSPVARADGQYVLVPDDILARLREHEKGVDAQGKLLSATGAQWRRNVLAFSPRWFIGNQLEGALRSVVAGAGPRSYATAKRVLGELDPQTRAQVEARTISGGNYESAARVSTDRIIRRDPAAENLGRLATSLYKLRQAPGPRHLADAYAAYTDLVFRAVNGRLETQYQTAMLGKALRDHPLMSERVRKLSQKAVQEAAEGLKDTATQAELGRLVDDMYGRYGKFSPGLQGAIVNYTPFAAWTLNATKFLTRVLPRDHPVLTGLLASANEATEEWRKSIGSFYDATGRTEGQLPPYLQGSIEGDEGSHLRLSRYTPFGLFNSGVEAGNPLEGFTGLLLPQFSEMIANVRGEDWKGKALAENPSAARDMVAVAASFLEGQIPLASQAASVAGVRLPNEADVKDPEQESVGTRVRKQFDPFMYTAASKSTSRKKRTSSASSSSSSSGGWGSTSTYGSKSSGGSSSSGWGTGGYKSSSSSSTGSGW